MPWLQASMVTELMTPLMPGAGPPPTTSASFPPLVVLAIACLTLRMPPSSGYGTRADHPGAGSGRAVGEPSPDGGARQHAPPCVVGETSIQSSSAPAKRPPGAGRGNRRPFSFSIPYRYTPLPGDAARGPVFRRHSLRQRIPTVSRAADGRQDGAAAPGRNTGGLEHLHGVLPGAAPRRLHLRPRRPEAIRPVAAIVAASARARAAAGRDGGDGRLYRSAGGRDPDARPAGVGVPVLRDRRAAVGDDRIAVFRGRDQRPAVAVVVFPARPSVVRRPL